MRQRTSSERLLQPVLLTAAALAIGTIIGVTCGGVGIAMYALTLPVGLFLLWASWDVASLDERLSPPEKKAQSVTTTIGQPTSPAEVVEAT